METRKIRLEVGETSVELELHRNMEVSEDTELYEGSIRINGAKYLVSQVPKEIWMEEMGYMDENFEPMADKDGYCYWFLPLDELA